MDMSPEKLKQLTEKWGELLDPKDDARMKNQKLREQTAIILENQEMAINETTTTTDPGVQQFSPILIPIARRIFPGMLAHEIVGVQPMTGPVGQAFAIRHRPSTTYAGQATTAVELGYNTVDSAYSAPGAASAGMTTSAGEWLGQAGGGTYNQVKLEVTKETITARTRKLRTEWSLEVEQDLKNMHGVDINSESTNILSYEINQEMDRELLSTIQSNVAETVAFNISAADGRWENERMRVFYNLMVRKANYIAKLTRRGSANFCVCSPDVAAMLETQNNFTLAPLAGNVDTLVQPSVAKVGAIDGRFTVYRDTFATSDYCLLGYKGPSVYDAGVIFCPYVPIMISRVTREASFRPSIGMMTRYGISTNIYGASNFYIMLSVTLTAQWSSAWGFNAST